MVLNLDYVCQGNSGKLLFKGSRTRRNGCSLGCSSEASETAKFISTKYSRVEKWKALKERRTKQLSP